jgi:hypothetical protein
MRGDHWGFNSDNTTNSHLSTALSGLLARIIFVPWPLPPIQIKSPVTNIAFVRKCR